MTLHYGHPDDGYVPTRAEADRDIHDNTPCSWANPCPACERANAR
jgi:hypothetical protein